jgi:hypothetical protein
VESVDIIDVVVEPVDIIDVVVEPVDIIGVVGILNLLIDHYYICDLHCMFVLRHISFTSANYQARWW